MKPHILTHHCSLFSSINHLFFWFFFCALTYKVILVWKQNNYSGSVTDRSAECLGSCESMPGFWCLSPCFPPTSTVSPVSWRCWPAIAVGQSSRCLRCAPRASVWREMVTGLSPLTLTHLEKRKKEKKIGGWRSSQLHWAPSSRAENPLWENKNCPFHEFVLLELSLYSKKCSVRRQAWDISKKDTYYTLQIQNN